LGGCVSHSGGSGVTDLSNGGEEALRVNKPPRQTGIIKRTNKIVLAAIQAVGNAISAFRLQSAKRREAFDYKIRKNNGQTDVSR
jgi:hypothetical protein